jgi:predicted lipoprotein with Yx(FWY)xxD motif
MTGLAAAAAAGLIAACGSTGTGQTASAGQTAGPAAASHGTVVSVRRLPGLGEVLVDRSGKTVYSSVQEAHGTIKCTGGCLSFWHPVKAARGAALRDPSGVTGMLGAVRRPDNGLTQLTFDGKPLYTFRLDQAPGQAHGNNFTDHFGSASFTWHAITTSGTAARPGGSGSSGGYGSPGGTAGY